MYENSDKLKGINPGELFARMVGEVPWGGLKAFIQTNAQLLKQVTAGGHRMDPKRRQRAEKIVLREAEKTEYPEAMVNGLFATWYPVHKELHQTLEDEDAWETKLAGQIRFLMDVINGTGAPVTEGALQRLEDLKGEWQTRKAEMNDIRKNYIDAINQWSAEQGIPYVGAGLANE